MSVTIETSAGQVSEERLLRKHTSWCEMAGDKKWAPGSGCTCGAFDFNEGVRAALSARARNSRTSTAPQQPHAASAE